MLIDLLIDNLKSAIKAINCVWDLSDYKNDTLESS